MIKGRSVIMKISRIDGIVFVQNEATASAVIIIALMQAIVQKNIRINASPYVKILPPIKVCEDVFIPSSENRHPNIRSVTAK